MDAPSKNQIRQVHLLHQRNLEIKRDGIPAFYHSGQGMHLPQLQIDQNYLSILSTWLQQKYSINVYDAHNFNQVALLDKANLYLEYNCLKLQDRRVERSLKNQSWYYIAKNNATISVLTKVFQETHQVEPWINAFINDDNITEIPPFGQFELQQEFYHNLNPSQQQAINKVIKNRFTFIKGPPGCGKTRIICRLCSIYAYNGCKVLVGAVSNTANYCIAESLVKETYEIGFQPNIVLFIPKQTSAENQMLPPEIRRLTFRQRIIENYLCLNQGEYYTPETLQFLLDECWGNRPCSNTFLSVYYQAIAKTFHDANIVISTSVSATKLDSKLAHQQKFKPYIGILDEASQATWGDTYCFLCRGIQKMVLVGDDKQLAPTVISQNQILKETMFTSLYKKNQNYYTLLDEQYRMHPHISHFPNYYFYEGLIKNSVEEHDRISEYSPFKEHPVCFINCESVEEEEIEGKSGKKNYWNQGEIDVIIQVLSVFPYEQYCNIGIISPYDFQVRKISSALGWDAFNWGLTVRTCDGYQGGQKDYIFFSCVRSNSQGKIGFCGEENRLNVSLTRARKGLMIIGNQATFTSENSQSQVWKHYIQYLKSNNKLFNSLSLPELIQPIPNIHQHHLQIQFIDEQQQQVQLLTVFKEDKKKLKKIMNNLSNSLKNVAQELQIDKKQEFLKEIKEIINPSGQNIPKRIKIFRKNMEQFVQLQEKIKNSGQINTFLQNRLKQICNQVILHCQQFNHIRQNQLLRRLIETKCLFLLNKNHSSKETHI